METAFLLVGGFVGGNLLMVVLVVIRNRFYIEYKKRKYEQQGK